MLTNGYKIFRDKFIKRADVLAEFASGNFTSLEPNPYSPYAYDIAYVWAIALNRLIDPTSNNISLVTEEEKQKVILLLAAYILPASPRCLSSLYDVELTLIVKYSY